MTDASATPWLALLLLGAVHGVNPGMGWLFAVARGLQERRSRAVWGTLGPLAVGHALALVAALGVAAVLGAVVPARPLRWMVAAALAAMGVRALARHRHVGRGGMRVNMRDLTAWSFLMASAHGAGLMVVPLVLDRLASPAIASSEAGVHATHTAHAARAAHAAIAIVPATTHVLVASLVHAAGYLLVTGSIAVVVYERLGLRLLRTAWINLDAIWAAALVVTAALTVAL